MKKHHFRPDDHEQTRRQRLNKTIDGIFARLSVDEIERLACGYERSQTRMLEIVHVRPRGCLVMDLYEDIEFKPVLFPEELIPLLKRHDVFMATIGWKGSAWEVLYLSPRYSENTISI